MNDVVTENLFNVALLERYMPSRHVGPRCSLHSKEISFVSNGLRAGRRRDGNK